MGIETHVSTGELGPGGHLRMLTPAEWQNWLVRGATWPEVGAGMAWVTSPLGALVEVLSGSAEHVLCLRHQSVERAALARRLARPEIAAEAAFNQDRMGDFEALAMANDAVVPHILKLFIWSPRRAAPCRQAPACGIKRCISREAMRREGLRCCHRPSIWPGLSRHGGPQWRQ